MQHISFLIFICQIQLLDRLNHSKLKQRIFNKIENTFLSQLKIFLQLRHFL